MAQIPWVEQVGLGDSPVLDKNREPLYEPSLINVKELLGSEDPVRYLSIYICVSNSSKWLSFV